MWCDRWLLTHVGRSLSPMRLAARWCFIACKYPPTATRRAWDIRTHMRTHTHQITSQLHENTASTPAHQPNKAAHIHRFICVELAAPAQCALGIDPADRITPSYSCCLKASNDRRKYFNLTFQRFKHSTLKGQSVACLHPSARTVHDEVMSIEKGVRTRHVHFVHEDEGPARHRLHQSEILQWEFFKGKGIRTNNDEGQRWAEHWDEGQWRMTHRLPSAMGSM